MAAYATYLQGQGVLDSSTSHDTSTASLVPSVPYPSSPPAYELIPHRVFVGGFASITTESDLRLYFEKFGHVRDAKVIRSPEGTSKGYGFITYDTEEEAQSVRNMASETLELNGRRLNLGPAMRKVQHNNRYTGGDFSVATPLNCSFQQRGTPSPVPPAAYAQTTTTAVLPAYTPQTPVTPQYQPMSHPTVFLLQQQPQSPYGGSYMYSPVTPNTNDGRFVYGGGGISPYYQTTATPSPTSTLVDHKQPLSSYNGEQQQGVMRLSPQKSPIVDAQQQSQYPMAPAYRWITVPTSNGNITQQQQVMSSAPPMTYDQSQMTAVYPQTSPYYAAYAPPINAAYSAAPPAYYVQPQQHMQSTTTVCGGDGVSSGVEEGDMTHYSQMAMSPPQLYHQQQHFYANDIGSAVTTDGLTAQQQHYQMPTFPPMYQQQSMLPYHAYASLYPNAQPNIAYPQRENKPTDTKDKTPRSSTPKRKIDVGYDADRTPKATTPRHRNEDETTPRAPPRSGGIAHRRRLMTDRLPMDPTSPQKHSRPFFPIGGHRGARSLPASPMHIIPPYPYTNNPRQPSPLIPRHSQQRQQQQSRFGGVGGQQQGGVAGYRGGSPRKNFVASLTQQMNQVSLSGQSSMGRNLDGGGGFRAINHVNTQQQRTPHQSPYTASSGDNAVGGVGMKVSLLGGGKAQFVDGSVNVPHNTHTPPITPKAHGH